MTSACLICLGDAPDAGRYHRACVRDLFGTEHIPTLDLELGKLHTAALAMVGHTSISGVQKKISLRLSRDRATLQVATEGGRFILKPQTGTFPHLPENEHVTMRIAAAAGIDVAACGLIHLADGSIAYVARRFDRTDHGKRRQEDFCQLAEQPPKDRYRGSAELCARIVSRYASEPLIELRKLYRQLAFTWFVGNGDMHLKNLSLLTGEDGLHRLSPAYDLLCTRLVIPDDRLALPVAGKDDNLTRRTFLTLADTIGLPRKAATRVLDDLTANLRAHAPGLIASSLLPDDMKQTLRTVIGHRT